MTSWWNALVYFKCFQQFTLTIKQFTGGRVSNHLFCDFYSGENMYNACRGIVADSWESKRAYRILFIVKVFLSVINFKSNFNRLFYKDVILQQLPPVGGHVVGQDTEFFSLRNQFQTRYGGIYWGKSKQYHNCKLKDASKNKLSLYYNSTIFVNFLK